MLKKQPASFKILFLILISLITIYTRSLKNICFLTLLIIYICFKDMKDVKFYIKTIKKYNCLLMFLMILYIIYVDNIIQFLAIEYKTLIILFLYELTILTTTFEEFHRGVNKLFKPFKIKKYYNYTFYFSLGVYFFNSIGESNYEELKLYKYNIKKIDLFKYNLIKKINEINGFIDLLDSKYYKKDMVDKLEIKHFIALSILILCLVLELFGK